jgi:hypothetical protein
MARRGLPPKTAQFFYVPQLGKENAYGNKPEMWSAPAASGLPRHCIHRRDCRMAAVAHAQHHFDRTIDDSGGYPCEYAYGRRDDIAIAEGRRDIYEF